MATDRIRVALWIFSGVLCLLFNKAGWSVTPRASVSFIDAQIDDFTETGTDIDADEPDRNYANAGLGLVFVAANGRQAFLSYREILGLSGFSRGTVNAGLRFEF